MASDPYEEDEYDGAAEEVAAEGLPPRTIISTPFQKRSVRTIDLRQAVPATEAVELAPPEKNEHLRIAETMWSFAEALKAHIVRILKWAPADVLIRHVTASTITFVNANTAKINILVPHPGDCLQLFIKTPVVNKARFSFPQFHNAKHLMYKERSCLVGGSTMMFVAYANPEIFEQSTFEPFILEWGKQLPINLYAVGALLGRLLQERHKNAQNKRASIVREITAAETSILELQNELRQADVEIRATIGDTQSMTEKAQETVSMLQRLVGKGRRYESIVFSSDTSYVKGITNMCFATHGGATYRLGKFAVTINLSTQRLSITQILANHMRASSDGGNMDFHHPHIMGTSICWGNAGTSVQDMLKRNELYGLFFTVGNFLNDYNDSNPYLRIVAWSRATERELNERRRTFESQDYEGLAREAESVAVPGPEGSWEPDNTTTYTVEASATS